VLCIRIVIKATRPYDIVHYNASVIQMLYGNRVGTNASEVATIVPLLSGGHRVRRMSTTRIVNLFHSYESFVHFDGILQNTMLRWKSLPQKVPKCNYTTDECYCISRGVTNGGVPCDFKLTYIPSSFCGPYFMIQIIPSALESRSVPVCVENGESFSEKSDEHETRSLKPSVMPFRAIG